MMSLCHLIMRPWLRFRFGDGGLAVIEDTNLSERWSPENAPWEWTGFILFLVGLYGSLQGPAFRHLMLWGVVPLDRFYHGLLGLGALVLILACWPLGRAEGPAGFVAMLWRVVALAAIAATAWFWIGQ